MKKVIYILSVASLLIMSCGSSGSSTSKSDSPGSSDDSDCTAAVKSHINRQNGKEVNYIQKSGDKYIVNIIDQTSKGVMYGGSYSATIYTDSDCNVTKVNISR